MHENEALVELRVEVEVELTIAESSRPEEEMALPITEWRFDPADVEREEIGLRGLHDAVEALEEGHRRDDLV
ncbi:hypothetical protein [Nonomuraea sp. NPDC050310]|uniref:hypothetical protein n=1 Tax=unclassified Nonomuraea TaxID=2593643 RepID=UPI0033C1B8EF